MSSERRSISQIRPNLNYLHTMASHKRKIKSPTTPKSTVLNLKKKSKGKSARNKNSKTAPLNLHPTIIMQRKILSS